MLRVNQDFVWTPNSNQEITYVEWHVRKNQVRGFLKRLSPKKQSIQMLKVGEKENKL